MSAPIAPERVLPTLNADGSRRRIRPRLYRGPKLSARTAAAWVLMLIFAVLPWLRIGGKPLVLLDLPRRQFTLFGHTFLPTDGALLMLFLLTVFVAIIALTALVGRAWCGWACPQTVYMEFLFRPIERLFEGPPQQQLRIDRNGPNLRRILKNAVFLLLAVLLANVFLSYFVGPRTLASWMMRSPFEHWSPFVLVAVTAALVFLDFAYFREQMCTVVCPYARLQSVLLDRRSLIVGYDRFRGEPRGKGKPKPGRGDCIDCSACVVACPTGIDIREGLQLECIACAQCADACDSIMVKIGKPRGLIRYGSQSLLEDQKPTRLLRTRVLIYLGVLAVLGFALVFAGFQQASAEVTIVRAVGAPFEQKRDSVTNQLHIKIRNRSSDTRAYRLELPGRPGVELVVSANPLSVPAGAQRTAEVFVLTPKAAFKKGNLDVTFRISDERDFRSEVSYRLLGPLSDAALGGQP